MKSLLLVTSALAAFAAAPALAQDGPVGSVGLTYGNTEIDLGGLGGDADTWAVDGVVAMPAFGDWTVTVAGSASQFDDGSDDTTFVGTGHLTTMVGSDLRVGGFVGAADVADETALTGGLEVQKYLSKATLTGVVAYTTADDVDLDAWSVGADAAFYVTDALRLNAGLSWMTIDDADVDGVTYGVGAEYEIANSPFSVTAGLSHSDIEDVDIDSWTVGLRYSFGGGLQARDRAGAALPGSGVMGILGAL
ncbi:outer membrane beta-barrel protein [Brevundimonas sp.]|uniref:outer membrane beta-barrel protein n=1 Tax=Brevundimonas sp. TaxID=1871086 RepID=UPI002D4989CA|nr:outer membrane beta-barrel protein [Brevundimonas sp.]HYC67747.1 outer membrane beta-barrel protein [Brevundimonas sp.]